jgi:hypothetical protein
MKRTPLDSVKAQVCVTRSKHVRMDIAERGAALIVVLAFVAMLLVLLMAFFSKSTLQQQVSKSSSTLGLADVFAQGAVDAIVGDLKQEIAAGSTVTSVVTGGATNVLYYPTTNTTAVPWPSGFTMTNGMENVVKISRFTNNFFPVTNSALYNTNLYPPTSRAAGLKGFVANGGPLCTTNASLNGRFISRARWNKPLLLPPTSTSDFTPTNATASFPGPDWILVSRSGTNPNSGSSSSAFNTANVWSATNPGTVIGRYAYIIYNEGGLLDANVAGYPLSLTNSTVTNPAYVPYKGGTYFADLTQIGLTTNQITALVGWRNYASGQASGAFPYSSSFTSDNGTNYAASVLANTNGLLSVATNTTSGGATDHQFASRQQLISFLTSVDSSAAAQSNAINSLRYLGSFSRALDQPSYAPPTNRPNVLPVASGGTLANANDNAINPSFLTNRLTATVSLTTPSGTTETRKAGDLLVKKRFPLNRLVWLTYKGPSANRTIPTSSSDTSTDQDMWLLVSKYGISTNYLAQGTAANIKQYFGLTWDGTKNAWTYEHNDDGAGTGASIKRLSDVAALSGANAREADFFELLKATIGVGSLGNALLNSKTALAAPSGVTDPGEVPENWQYSRDASVDGQIIQIGANIINQSRCDNFPILINFNDGSLGNRQFAGVANLPYIANVVNGLLQIKQPNNAPYSGPNGPNGEQYISSNSDTTYGSLTDPGLGAVMQFPILWNPHSVNSPFPSSGIRPTYFRVVSDSTTPDNVNDIAANYWQVITYAKSGKSATNGSMPVPDASCYSYNPDPSSPLSVGGQALAFSSLYTPSAQPLTAANSALQFQVTTQNLFREPTVLYRPNYPTGSSLQVDINNHRIAKEAPVNKFFSSGGLPTSVLDPCGFGTVSSVAGAYHSANANSFLGFYLGSYPLRWISKGTDNNMYAMASSRIDSGGGVYVARYNKLNDPGYLVPCYFTYRVQYATTSSGPWYTYDTKYGKYSSGASGGWNASQVPLVGYIGAPTLFAGYDKSTPAGSQRNGDSGYWCTAIDPRSGRFGLVTTAHEGSTSGGAGHAYTVGYRLREPAYNPVSLGGWNISSAGAGVNLFSYWGWLDYINGVTGTLRTFAQAGAFTDSWKDFQSKMPRWNYQQHFINGTGADLGLMVPLGSFAQNNADSWTSYQASFSECSSACQIAPFYYADPDGVVRRSMGAYVPRATNGGLVSSSSANYAPAVTTVGIPTARASINATVTTNLGIDGTMTIISNSVASTANYTYQDQSRPYFLNRPFRTVAELGSVFRDTPWKNLDFFTPESADNALLDVFTISENMNSDALVAGKVDLNTRQQPVLQSIVSGGMIDDAQVGLGLVTPATIATNSLASNVALALINRTTNTVTSGYGPLINPADLIGRFLASNAPVTVSSTLYVTPNTGTPLLTAANGFSDGKLSYTGFSGGLWDTNNGAPKISSPAADITSAIPNAYSASATLNGMQETLTYVQRFHEAPIRALTAAGQTRVWNLMIDVIAQTGRYPKTVTNNLNSFMVEGEQRYWVHLAIDRLTGQVLDKQIEVVKE